jgi:hypothetical protein
MAGTRPSKSSGDVPCDLGNPRARSLKAPDAADPNDRAFRLVRCTGTFLIICSVRARRTNVASLSQITANGVSVTEALDLCNATMKRRAMYARIARWRKRLQQAREDEQVAESAVFQLLKGEARATGVRRAAVRDAAVLRTAVFAQPTQHSTGGGGGYCNRTNDR